MQANVAKIKRANSFLYIQYIKQVHSVGGDSLGFSFLLNLFTTVVCENLKIKINLQSSVNNYEDYCSSLPNILT